MCETEGPHPNPIPEYWARGKELCRRFYNAQIWPVPRSINSPTIPHDAIGVVITGRSDPPLGPKQVPSAFVKQPISGTARAERLGLNGDEQADLTVHGGPDKAVYFYPSEHYPRWAADVPRHKPILLPGDSART